MKCGIHNRDMKQNTKGWYCSTPITKSADGKEVLEWCKWKPESPETPSNTVPLPETRVPVEQRDYDKENRGKVRHGLVTALIESGGQQALEEIVSSPKVRQQINFAVEFVMSGEEI